jgi:ADP-ribose pyrophosphatase
MIKQKSSKVVYQNKWMTVKEDQVEFEGGMEGIYGVVEKPDFVLVIPYDQGKLHLVKQYRYTVKGSYWEFPQGSYEGTPALEPIEVVKKELKEETGLVPAHLQQLGHLFEAYGYSNQGFYIFLATDLTQKETEFEPTEIGMLNKAVTVSEFEEMVRNGEIKDSPTLAAFSLFKMNDLD